jgi:hypothetical protein
MNYSIWKICDNNLLLLFLNNSFAKNYKGYVRFQVLTAASMKFRFVEIILHGSTSQKANLKYEGYVTIHNYINKYNTFS